MDVRAISLASDEYLKELGIVAQGDILSLKAFTTGQLGKKLDASNCDEESQQKSREQRKKMLIEKLLLGKKKGLDRKSVKDSKEKKAKVTCVEAVLPKVKTRKVKLAWQHYNVEVKRYVMVRESTGGGQREMPISTTANQSEILTILSDLFFPDGESSRGQSSEMDFYLGNFKCEVIFDDDFSLGKYINANKLTKPRLYLLSKHKSSPTDCNTCGAKDDWKPHQSVLTPEQEGQSVHAQNWSVQDLDGDDVTLCQPVFASTPEQNFVQHISVPDNSDDSDHEIVFKGYGLYDHSLLLEDTIVVPEEVDSIQNTR